MIKHFPLIVLLSSLITASSSINASWQKVNMPTENGFTAIWALNEQTIFAVGDEGLWKTFNGNNWILDTVIPFFEYVYFVDDTLGFIGYNHFTTDGGKTWHKVDGLFPGWNVDFPPGQSFLGYGGYSLSGDLNYPKCHLFKTTDGGWHWDTLPALPEVYLDSKEDISLGGLSFPTTDTGYVTASCLKRTSDTTVEQHLSYFKTTDGGQTWKLNEIGLYNDDFNPYLVDFPQNATVGYMAGGGGKVFKTINGGTTWDTVLVDTSMSMNDMTFPETDQVGYVIGSNKAYRTLNGGQTWQHHEFGGDTILLSCHFVDNRLGFITGINNIEKLCILYDPGFVLKTTDGLLGITEEEWVDVRPKSVEIISSIGFEVMLSYSNHPQGFHALVYDASGRKVDELHSSLTDGTVNWGGGRPCGVYFIRPVETEKTRPLRVVLVR